MQSWFVYYKVQRSDVAVSIARSRRIATAVAALTATAPRVLRKLDNADVATVMETYDAVIDAERFEAALSDAVRAAGMPADLLIARRIERFESCEA